MSVLENQIMRNKRLEWHRYFCIIPRKLNDEWFFLKYVERKQCFYENIFHAEISYWEYRQMRFEISISCDRSNLLGIAGEDLRAGDLVVIGDDGKIFRANS